MGVGQHLIVQLSPAAPVTQLLIPRHDGELFRRQTLPQDLNRAVAAAVVVDDEMINTGLEMKIGPLANMTRFVPHDQTNGEAGSVCDRLRWCDRQFADGTWFENHARASAIRARNWAGS